MGTTWNLRVLLYKSKSYRMEGICGPFEFYFHVTQADPKDGEILMQYAKLVWELHHDQDSALDYFEVAVLAAPQDCGYTFLRDPHHNKGLTFTGFPLMVWSVASYCQPESFRNGVEQIKTSWQGVLRTNCSIPPGSQWTYHMQVKDQIDVEDDFNAHVAMWVQHTEPMIEEINKMDEDIYEEPLLDIDDAHEDDPLSVVGYINDICAHYRKQEVNLYASHAVRLDNKT